MISRQSSKVLALLALVIGISACTSPTAPPKVELCQDPAALNYQQPVPCVPKTTFSETKISLVSTSPPAESTVFLSVYSDGTGGNRVAGSDITAKVQFQIAEEHLNKAKAEGKQILLRACFFNSSRLDSIAGCGNPVTLAEGVKSGVAEIQKLKLLQILNPTLERTEVVWLFVTYYSDSSGESLVVDPVPESNPLIWKKS